jgi:DNA-binding IclR family transcriptional regulator
LGVVQIANSLGLAKSTAYGLLKTLHEVGFVRKDATTGRYGALLDTQSIGTSQIDPHELRARSINYADSLASRTGEAVRVGVLAEQSPAVVLVRTVHHVFRPDHRSQTLEIGADAPAHACALGKVILAYNAGAAITTAAGPLTPMTACTITTAPELARTLAEIRARGWAADVEELSIGQAGIAAPIRLAGGLVVGAIGISGELDRITSRSGLHATVVPRQALVAEVLHTSRCISAEFGEPA